MTQEELKLVLDALENGDVPTPKNAGKNLDAITAIKEALAQTQEPVAWQFMNGSNFRKRRPDDFADLDSDGLPYWKPLYTNPPQRTWVGLTRDEQSFVYSNLHNATSRKDSFWVDFANAIEAKLKEKNSA
jgi:hypothetical protein